MWLQTFIAHPTHMFGQEHRRKKQYQEYVFVLSTVALLMAIVGYVIYDNVSCEDRLETIRGGMTHELFIS